jgi:hypothetical protein
LGEQAEAATPNPKPLTLNFLGEQAEAAEAARSAARSVSIAIFGAESDDNALIYVAASHMLLATRSWIFKQKKE